MKKSSKRSVSNKKNPRKPPRASMGSKENMSKLQQQTSNRNTSVRQSKNLNDPDYLYDDDFPVYYSNQNNNENFKVALPMTHKN